jgi:hypothetical protein
VHTLILEIYDQFLSPIGLPRETRWLDFDHLWITGVPVHCASIFAGDLTALRSGADGPRWPPSGSRSRCAWGSSRWWRPGWCWRSRAWSCSG